MFVLIELLRRRSVLRALLIALAAALLGQIAAAAGIAFAGEADNEGTRRSGSLVVAQSALAAEARAPEAALRQLIGEALKHNPEIAAALHEKDAAGHRISPAGALDDPMLEAGFLNLPINTWRFNREDMTMKMLGIAQKLPYPGKLGLRQEVAAKNAESVAFGYRETVSRVIREVKIAYYDVALIDRSIELLERNRLLVEQLLRIAEGRYGVG